MTNIMTEQDEEKILIDQLQSKRAKVEKIKAARAALMFDQNEAEHELEQVEQAIIDYMTGNGLLQFANLELGKSYSVDVENIEAVPEKYIRVKTTREVNKALIRAERPEGVNWYTMKESYKLTVKTNTKEQ